MPRLATAPWFVLASAACLAGVAGCVHSNDRLSLGNQVELEAFSTDATGDRVTPGGPIVPGDQVWTAGRTPQPIDRSGWGRTEFLVPVDGVGHRPAYTTRVMLKNSTARQRGEYPTAVSALELTGGFTDEEFTDVWTTPLVVFGSALAIPVRLFLEPQWTEDRSPAMGYQRWQPVRRNGDESSNDSQEPHVVEPDTADHPPVHGDDPR